MTQPAELSGLIPNEVGDALRGLAMQVPDGQCVVEIGSFKGKSTAFLAQGCQSVFAVDPWDLAGNVTGRFGFADPSTRETFEAQLRQARVWSRVTPIRGFSTDVAKTWSGPPIGLLYVDGDHSEKAVRADVKAWSPHLAPGHCIAFDDLDTPKNPGVRVVVEELQAAGYLLHVMAGRLAVMRR